MYWFVLCYVLVTAWGRGTIFSLEVNRLSTPIVVTVLHSPMNMDDAHREALEHQPEIPTEILLFHASWISYTEELFSLFHLSLRSPQDCGWSQKIQLCPACLMPFVFKKLHSGWMQERKMSQYSPTASWVTLVIFITISISNYTLKYCGIFHSFVHPQLCETIKDGCLILSRACSFSCPTSPLLKQHFIKFLG